MSKDSIFRESAKGANVDIQVFLDMGKNAIKNKSWIDGFETVTKFFFTFHSEISHNVTKCKCHAHSQITKSTFALFM